MKSVDRKTKEGEYKIRTSGVIVCFPAFSGEPNSRKKMVPRIEGGMGQEIRGGRRYWSGEVLCERHFDAESERTVEARFFTPRRRDNLSGTRKCLSKKKKKKSDVALLTGYANSS
jgi:hypothetical protein